MKLGESFEPKPVAKKEITPQSIESLSRQLKIEQSKIYDGLKIHMTPDQQIEFVSIFVNQGLDDQEREVIELLEKAKERVDLKENDEKPVEEVITDSNSKERVEDKTNKIKMMKVGAGALAGVTALAALSFGPMEKKAEAEGININMNAITDSLKRGMSNAIEDTLRGVGRGTSDAAQDLFNRGIGGGLTPQEKSRLMHEKIRLETTKAYDIQRMEMDEIRDMRRFQREMDRQDYRLRLDELRMKQQIRREILKDYRKALTNSKTPDDAKMAGEKFNASLKALGEIEKGNQSMEK